MKPFLHLILFSILTSSLCWSVPDLKEGVYKTEGVSPYHDSKFVLSHWAESYLLDGKLEMEGALLDVHIKLEPTSDPVFYKGSGTVRVGSISHKMGAEIFLYENRFYFRENTPEWISVKPCNGICTSPYIWHDHEKPYVLVN